ncbi:hypothetical protein Rsph17029_0107 [Rhodobacter sphaeroides ATCC 17029]|nr:hypothetical protein Rsph17029_0107 [Cereibacter sphaeroides ATCC 17029]
MEPGHAGQGCLREKRLKPPRFIRTFRGGLCQDRSLKNAVDFRLGQSAHGLIPCRSDTCRRSDPDVVARESPWQMFPLRSTQTSTSRR